jgi:LCP family protein required for cell wall assembly
VGFIILVFISLPYIRFLQKNKLTPSFIADLIVSENPPFKKYQGRTNFVLLGIPGKTHEGVDLTDTIIFVSIGFKKSDILMVSLPRDIWLDSLKDKINTAYHYGEEKKEGGGFILAKSSVSEVVGLPVHYALLIDFEGFENIINLVGGIDVNVENPFTDNKFPIPGRENDLCNGDKEFRCRYETVSFRKGLQHMNGETTLKFVRSRNAEGDEGTDFAREKRQQQVILALQKKLLSITNLTPSKISGCCVWSLGK